MAWLKPGAIIFPTVVVSRRSSGDAPLLRLQPRWKYPLLSRTLLSRTRTLFRGGRLEGVLRGAFFLELLINAVHQFLNFAVFVTLRVVRAGFHGASLPHARLRAQIASNFNSRSAFGGPVDGVITRRVVPAVEPDGPHQVAS